jgi:hypothetical protein
LDNIGAIRSLTNLIQNTAESNGLVDNFDMLSAWENSIETHKCQSIGASAMEKFVS